MSRLQLYTSEQIESADERARLTREVLIVLSRGYGYRVMGSFPNGSTTVYVRDGHRSDGGVSYGLWGIVDNGGEFNVELLNSPDMRSIPYIECGVPVDSGTVAYRIAMVIKGEKIDYDARFPELFEDLKELSV